MKLGFSNPFVAIIASVLACTSISQAATKTWDAGGGDLLWNTGNNWNTNGTPANGDTIVFANTFTSGTAINLNGNRTINDLSITGTTDFSLNNNILTITSGDIGRTQTTGTTTINSDIILGGAADWNIAGSSSNGTLIVNGIIDDGAGTLALDKTGTGKLVLNNANTFGGTLTLNAGILVLGNNSAAGSGTLGLSGGTIEGAGGTRTISNNLTITANNTFAGSDLVFTDSFDQGAGRTYTVNNTTTFSGSLTGGDNLTKSGTGTLILSGDNSAGTAIDIVTVNTGGALRVAHNGALGTTAFDTVVNDGGALELSGGRTIGAEALSLRGTGVGGNGALRSLSGNNSWAGNITLTNDTQVHRINSDAGLLTISGGISETGNNNNKDLTFGGAGDTTVSGVITSTAGGTDMRLFKDGNGNLNLTNANTYDGTTTISGGTLFANNASGSATGTGAVSVGSGGKLGGTGFIAPTGANGINVSGVLSPGSSVSTVGNLRIDLGGTSGTVAMSGGSGLEFLLGVAGSSITTVGTSDLLSIAGAAANDVAFNNNAVDFLNSGTVGFYKLFDTSSDNANTWTGLTFNSISGVVSSGLTATNLSSSLTGTFIVGTSSNGGTTGDIYLQVVPEPSSLLLLGSASLLLLRRRRED